LTLGQVKRSDLTDADLTSCIMHFVLLSGCSLNRTNSRAARMVRMHWANLDLSAARNLEDAVYGGPSTVGLDTVVKRDPLKPAPLRTILARLPDTTTHIGHRE
jgi:hypothetical protein